MATGSNTVWQGVDKPGKVCEMLLQALRGYSMKTALARSFGL